MSDIGSRGIRSDRAIEGHLQYAQNWVALKANLRLVAWGGILIVSMRTTKMGKMMAVVAGWMAVVAFCRWADVGVCTTDVRHSDRPWAGTPL